MRVDAIEAKIYIEGVLLPGRAWGMFECTSQRRGHTTGSIIVPALPGIRQEEWARARVHVFWSNLAVRARTTDWPILFEGEIVGSAFAKTPGSRNIVFQLAGPEIYWEQCKLYFYNFGTGTGQQGGSNLDVVNVNRRTFFFGNQQITLEAGAPGLNLENRILATMTKGDQTKPLTSRIRRVIKDTTGTNHFFSLANANLGLDKRFALPRDDNVSLLYANTQLFFTQIEGNVAAREGEVAIGSVLRDMLALLRYNWTSNPQPKFTTGGEQYRLRVDQERVRLATQLDDTVFDRMGRTTAELGVTSNTSDDELQIIASDRTLSLVSAANDPARADTLTDAEQDLLADPRTMDVDVAERNRARVGETFAFLITVRDELRRIAQPATEVDDKPLFPADEDQPADQLAHFLLLPETEFALPPACNVIFPNESASYGFSRDHLTEPTRSLLSVPIVDNGIQKLYFAPDTLANAKIPAQTIEHVSITGTYPPVLQGKFSLPHITSHFGRRPNPLVGEGGPATEGHGAIDFGVAVGTLVYAFDDGTVTHAGPQVPSDLKKGGGIYVGISHANGAHTEYLHLSEVLVGEGAKVTSGQPIGLSGNTGRSTGPHLHFAYYLHGEKQDPEPLVNQALQNLINQATTNDATEQSIEVPEVTIAEGIQDTSSRFDDFKYLTPEEEVLGIVPMFDTSMDKVSAAFGRNKDNDNAAATLDAYMSQYAISSFQRSKYGARSANSIPMPWAPRIACGFPALVVDPVRSYIAQIESVTHRINVQGGAEATTIVTVSQPRFWDEGDPFYWIDGVSKFKTGEQIPSVPDPAKARFPNFYLPSFVATNSYDTDPTYATSNEAFGGSIRNRPIDELYQSILGVNAIPYFYEDRENPATGATVAFNKAIDGTADDGSRGLRTIVGYYESLLLQSKELAQQFVQNYTQRYGASESEIMVDFLKSDPGDGGYQNGPFRAAIRGIVKDYVNLLSSARAFRG